jgi:hypothetical protein
MYMFDKLCHTLSMYCSMVGGKSCRAESATRAGKVKTRPNVTHDFNAVELSILVFN